MCVCVFLCVSVEKEVSASDFPYKGTNCVRLFLKSFYFIFAFLFS